MLKKLGAIAFVLAVFGAGLLVGLSTGGQSQAAGNCQVRVVECDMGYFEINVIPSIPARLITQVTADKDGSAIKVKVSYQ